MAREFASGKVEVSGKKTLSTLASVRDGQGNDHTVIVSSEIGKSKTKVPDGPKAFETIEPGNYQEMVDLIHQASGNGPRSRQRITLLSQHDRFGRIAVAPHAENVGLTFITRPRLCLQPENCRRDPAMIPLLNPNPNSIGFMIRALLDTKWARDASNVASISSSQLLNPLSPFNIPLSNMLLSISGFPDPYIDTHTTQTGFQGEDQTYAIGSNRLMATYDLSLTFQDMDMAPIAYMLFFWRQYIDNVARGITVAYDDDIDGAILNYTVSIYRFTLDPTRRFIIKYSKATGCFPRTVPFGDMMNFGEGDVTSTSSARFTIPFVANMIEHCDPGIILDFNVLVERYAAQTLRANGEERTANRSERAGVMQRDFVTLSNTAFSNFAGVPYIEETENGLMLVFKYPKQ